MLDSILVDVVLVLHAAIAGFVVIGLIAIIGGNLRGWRWVNNLWFRLAHLGAIAFVVAESWFGIECPLTTLEMWLRVRSGQSIYAGGFIAHWMARMLYYDFPPWVFLLAYTLFGIAVGATWWFFPPRFPCSRHRAER